jgi:hypothetical protein
MARRPPREPGPFRDPRLRQSLQGHRRPCLDLTRQGAGQSRDPGIRPSVPAGCIVPLGERPGAADLPQGADVKPVATDASEGIEAPPCSPRVLPALLDRCASCTIASAGRLVVMLVGSREPESCPFAGMRGFPSCPGRVSISPFPRDKRIVDMRQCCPTASSHPYAPAAAAPISAATAQGSRRWPARPGGRGLPGLARVISGGPRRRAASHGSERQSRHRP